MGDRSGLLWGQFDISTLLRNSRAVRICAERTLSCETSPEKNIEVWFHFDPFHIHDRFFFVLLDPFSSLCPFLDFSTCTGLETVGWLPGNHCSSGKNICVFVEWWIFFLKKSASSMQTVCNTLFEILENSSSQPIHIFPSYRMLPGPRHHALWCVSKWCKIGWWLVLFLFSDKMSPMNDLLADNPPTPPPLLYIIIQ